MIKYVAHVQTILQAGIHTVARIHNDEIVAQEPLPMPDRIEIETSQDRVDCMMYRYTDTDTFCGDTWHQDLDTAFGQAAFEYGLTPEDFVVVQDSSGESQP